MATSGSSSGINFDRVAAEYDATRGGVERARDAARDVSPHLPAGDVLEIGVGTGILAAALLEGLIGSRRLVGVDISSEMLQRAVQRLPGRVVRAAAQALPFADGQFGGVVAVHVLHLVADMSATLAEAARVLQPGGRVVAVHGERVHEDDELTRAMSSLRARLRQRPDSPDAVAAAARTVGLRMVAQQPASARNATYTPAELADLVERRSWSFLWALDDGAWAQYAMPVIAALRTLPDQDRPRVQQSRAWVTVLERDRQPS